MQSCGYLTKEGSVTKQDLQDFVSLGPELVAALHPALVTVSGRRGEFLIATLAPKTISIHDLPPELMMLETRKQEAKLMYVADRGLEWVLGIGKTGMLV
jgi:hypothetical protein